MNNTFHLTDIQIDFVLKAIDVKEAVLDFDLHQPDWDECYPYTKEEMLHSIVDLRKESVLSKQEPNY